MAEINTGTTHLDYVLDLLDGIQRSTVAATACKLELFDEFLNGPVSARALAEKKGWDADKLYRFLNTIVSIKLLEKTVSPSDELKDEFRLSPAGRLLARKSPDSMWDYAECADMFATFLKSIPDAIQKKSSKSDDQKAASGEGEHSHEEYTEEENLSSCRMLGYLCGAHLKPLITRFDLGIHKSAVDLGGGTGVVSFGLVEQYPGMQVSLFELPSIAEMTRKHFFSGKENLGVKIVAGDFTKDDLPQADLYLMSKVVYHWRDDQIDELVSKVFKSTNPGGGVLIMEKILTDAKDGPSPAMLWDIMCMAEGSRTRSGKELKNILEKHGYHQVQIVRSQEACPYDLVYARKPQSGK